MNPILRSDTTERSCLVYSPKQNKWRTGPSMKIRRRMAGLVVMRGKLFVVGDAFGSVVVERLNQEKGKWEVSQARIFACMTSNVGE